MFKYLDITLTFQWSRVCAFGLIYAALGFSILWQGSIPFWRASIVQTLMVSAFLCYAVGKIFTGRPVFGSQPLLKPLAALLVLVTVSGVFAVNRFLSLNAAVTLLTYMAGFFVFVEMGKFRNEQIRLAWFVVCITTALCVFGLLVHFHFFLFPMWKNLALFQGNNLCATFVNHCHMAGWTEMALLFGSALLFVRSRTVPVMIMLIACFVIMTAALVLTLSRGGWISAATGAVFMAVTAFFNPVFVFSRKYLVLGAGVIACLLLFILGSTSITSRGLTIIEPEVDALSGRTVAWTGTMAMIKTYPWTGAGPGNYATVFTQFQPGGNAIRFYEAHSDYLQFTAELGLFFILVVLWLIIVFFKTGFSKLHHPSRQTRWITLGAMGGVVAILVHSVSDFNLQIPSNALLFTLLAAQVAAPAPPLKK